MKKIIILLIAVFSYWGTSAQCSIIGPDSPGSGAVYSISELAQCTSCYDWDVSPEGSLEIIGSDQESSVVISCLTAGDHTISVTYFTEEGCFTCEKTVNCSFGCCKIENIQTNQVCIDGEISFDVSFDASGGSGLYNIYQIPSGALIGSGTSPINITPQGPITAGTVIEFVIQDQIYLGCKAKGSITVCMFENVGATNLNCEQGSAYLDVFFNIENGSGNYGVFLASDGSQIGSGSSSPIAVFIPGPFTQVSSVDYYIQDLNNPCCKEYGQVTIDCPPPCLPCTDVDGLKGLILCICGGVDRGYLWFGMDEDCRAKVTSIDWDANGAGLSFLGGANSGTTTGPPPPMGLGTLENIGYACEDNQNVFVEAVVHFINCPDMVFTVDIAPEVCDKLTTAVSLSPNPTSDVVNISINAIDPADSYKALLFDSNSGQLVETYNIETNGINPVNQTLIMPNLGEVNTYKLVVMNNQNQVIAEKVIVVVP